MEKVWKKKRKKEEEWGEEGEKEGKGIGYVAIGVCGYGFELGLFWVNAGNRVVRW